MAERGRLRRVLGKVRLGRGRRPQATGSPVPPRRGDWRATGRARAGAPGDGPQLSYAPRADGRADPGEVVWAWVPYEEGDGRGKDRPVLVVGRDGDRLLALSLTSKDHDRDAVQEAAAGRHWMDVGAGGWDRERRPSEVRLDRLLRLDPASVRREGAALDPDRFDAVVRSMRAHRQGR